MAIADNAFGGLSVNGVRLLMLCEGWSGGADGTTRDFGSACKVVPNPALKSGDKNTCIGPGMTGWLDKWSRETINKGLLTSNIGEQWTIDEVVKVWQKALQVNRSSYMSNLPADMDQPTFDGLTYICWHKPADAVNALKKWNAGGKSAYLSWLSGVTGELSKNQGTMPAILALAKGESLTGNAKYSAYMGTTDNGVPQKLLDFAASLNLNDAGFSGSFGNDTSFGGGGGAVFGNVYGQSYGIRTIKEGQPNTVYRLETYGERNNVLTINNERKKEFKAMQEEMVNQVPNRERDIILSTEMSNSSIMKTTQSSKQERKVKR